MNAKVVLTKKLTKNTITFKKFNSLFPIFDSFNPYIEEISTNLSHFFKFAKIESRCYVIKLSYGRVLVKLVV